MVGVLTRRAGVVSALIATAIALAASPAAALPAFGTAQATVAGVGGTGPGLQVVIKSVEVGRHAGFDRIVFTSSNGRPSATVRYVTQVKRDPSGEPVSLLGAAAVLVTLRNTAWQTSPSPQPKLAPLFPALCQLEGVGEFEAVASYGLGQTTKAGFRVFTLTNPDRVVVDLASPSGQSLPTTGFPAPVVIGLGVGLLVVGIAVYFFSRRRRIIWSAR